MPTSERIAEERVDELSEVASNGETDPASTFQVKNMSIWYGEKRAIQDITMDIA